MHRFTAVAALALAAALVACGDQDSTLAPHPARRGLDGPTTALVVEADLPIARLQVTIADGQGSRDVELKRENDEGLLAGVIDAQPGASAKLAFRAYDAHGNLTHEGEGAVDVGKDVTPQVELALAPVPGADQAAVRIGTYRLALTTTELDGGPGSAYDMEASLVDARGERHAIGKEGLSWSPPG